MGKLIPSIFSMKRETWQYWPSCKHPKTASFRADDHMFKTVNSVFFDPDAELMSDTPRQGQGSLFTNSSESASISTESEEFVGGDQCAVETIICGARGQTDRLFFDGCTGSTLEKSGGSVAAPPPFKESVVMAMESEDPYVDFKKSMEEMVESHGLKDWECLEELLGWYLRVNGKNNHGFILGAFVDLLVGISGGESSTKYGALMSCDSTTSYSSAASTFPSPSN